WEYDVQGRKVAKQYPDGSRIGYTYDSASSRLAQITDEKGQVTRYTYQIDDNLAQVTYSNCPVATPTVSFQYDTNFDRLVSMTDGTGTTTYSYYPITGASLPGAGLLASVDGPLSNDTITYTYDEVGQMANRAINGVGISVVRDQADRVTVLT